MCTDTDNQIGGVRIFKLAIDRNLYLTNMPRRKTWNQFDTLVNKTLYKSNSELIIR